MKVIAVDDGSEGSVYMLTRLVAEGVSWFPCDSHVV